MFADDQRWVFERSNYVYQSSRLRSVE